MFLFFSFFLVYIPDKNCSNQQLGQEEGEGERERRSPPPPPVLFSLDRFTYLRICQLELPRFYFFIQCLFPSKTKSNARRISLCKKKWSFWCFPDLIYNLEPFFFFFHLPRPPKNPPHPNPSQDTALPQLLPQPTPRFQPGTMQRYHPPRPRLDSAGDEVDRLSCGLVGSGNEVEAGDEGVDGAGEGKEGGEDVGYAGVGATGDCQGSGVNRMVWMGRTS